MFSVHDQRSLSSQLLRIVGQRLAHVILNASESSERAGRLSRLPTQISSWIKSQVMWTYMFCYYLWLSLQRFVHVKYLPSMFIRGKSKQLVIKLSVFKINTKIGTFINHHDGDNGNVKKQSVLSAKQQVCTFIPFFLKVNFSLTSTARLRRETS